MHLKHLSLRNFRSYSDLELPLSPGITIFLGRNGEGKTNIVEAIVYLAFLSSHRTAGDLPLVKLGESAAYARAQIQHPDREILVELEINADKANRARINQNPIRGQKGLFGLIQCIYFCPEDMDLVRGDPSERRRFIDQILILRSPRMAGVITDYEKAVRQRNALLKTRANQTSLEPWNQQVAKFGAEIIAARISLLNEFEPFFNKVYATISSDKPAHIKYKSAIPTPATKPDENYQAIISKMLELRAQEMDRGLTLVGPHRDDLVLHLGKNLVKGYASHGESWSIALSLKLAAYNLLVQEGIKPILILDDVFSELDEERRHQLIELAKSAEQTLITVAVEGDLPKDLHGTTFHVKNGSVKLKS